jgi:sterol desaturase/sphingolipid hydroxylase (fatty acid hydroxylase superfamily)
MPPLPSLERIDLLLSASFFVLLPVELWRRRRAGTLTWAVVREMAASASPLVPTLAFGGAALALVHAAYVRAAALAPRPVATTWASALACLVLVDFLAYWDHRCAHRVGAVWALGHSVHHSSPQFDQTTALRVSFVEGLFSPWFYLPAVLAGFEPKLVLACFGVTLAYQQWLHTEAVGKLGWFDRAFNSPSNHRVHHAAQAAYLDRNYGSIFMAWDHLFGTYRAEAEPPRYGLTRPIRSSHPVRVHTAEALRLIAAWRRADSWAARVALLVRGPEGFASPASGAMAVAPDVRRGGRGP